MVIQTVAAGHCLKQLRDFVGDTLHTNERYADAFLGIIETMRKQHIVSATPQELRALRQEIVRDALGLKMRRHPSVRALVRNLAQTPVYLAPRAAGVGGSAMSHRFGLRACALS
jgi:hypothetical protein